MQRLLRVRGARPGTCPGALGQLRPDRPAAVDGLRSRRYRPVVPVPAQRAFDLGPQLSDEGPVKAYFQVPDTPEVPEIVKGTGAQIVDGSTQTTNSWGLRGPEPDLSARWRGIVLGDSYMQGLFVGDHQTPVECLKRDLKARLGASVEILNTGHLGYSPEQYYYTLDRICPAVPASIRRGERLRQRFRRFSGSARGQGGLGRGSYWLGMIRDYCFAHEIERLFVAGALGQSDRRAADGRELPGQDRERSGMHRARISRPDRRVSPTPSSRSETACALWVLRRAEPAL